MNKGKSIIILMLFLPVVVWAQKNKSDREVTDVFKVNFLIPGVSYEKAFGKRGTVYMDIFPFPVAATTIYASAIETHLFIGPALALQYRYYYNYEKRVNLRTQMNSLNYVAPINIATLVKTEKGAKPKFFDVVGAVWGIQRNYSGRFGLDVNVGAGYVFLDKNTTVRNTITLINQIKLGFWLNKNNKEK